MIKKIRNGVFVILLAVVLLILLNRFVFKPSAAEATGEIDFRTDMSKPRGIRNNNPGNIKIAGNKWLGKVPENQNSDGTFEQFFEYRYGIRAMILLLISYMLKHDKRNLVELIARYTAGDTAEEQANYVTFVSEKTKISPVEYLSPNKETLRKLVKAMTHRENDVAAVTDTQFDEAYKLATS